MPGKGIGHFFGAMRVDAVRKADEFKQQMDQGIRRFRGAKTVAGEEKVLIPGDPEREMEQQRIKAGIPLLLPVFEDLQSVGAKMGVPFPAA
jgi:LDH2 family malate/lactate/ureidoglycolate dehydrogenase